MSNDNPFIESFFKTLKYTTGYPGAFRNRVHAREWLASFVHWYNFEHLHSAIGYITPMEKRNGSDIHLFKKRNETIEEARQQKPERWGMRDPRKWEPDNVVILNPGKKTKQEQEPVSKKPA